MENNINQQSITLTDSQRIGITKLKFGCSWGMQITDTLITIVDDNGFYGIGSKSHKENQRLAIDLDLSCVLLDEKGKICDSVYSPKFKKEMLRNNNLPYGKYETSNGSIRHSGDDIKGSKALEDSAIDNECLSIDLSKIDSNVSEIIIFLNDSGLGEFSKLPYIRLRLSNSLTNESIWEIDATKLPQCNGNNALIIGKFVHTSDIWQYRPMLESYIDETICDTIKRILNKYK